MVLDFLRALRPLKSVPSRYRRRSYRHMAGSIFIGLFFTTVLVHGPYVIRQLGGSALQCLLLNVGRGLPLVPALLWVSLIERRNPVRLTGLLLGLGGPVLMLTAFAGTTWSLTLVLTGSMVLVAFFKPAFGTALEQIYPRRWRGRLMSLPWTGDVLCRAVCLVVVGLILKASLQSYRWIFPLAGLCMVAGAVILRGIHGSRGLRVHQVEEMREGFRRRAARSLKWALSQRRLLAFLLGYFVVTCGGVLLWNVMPLFASDELRLTPAQWGYARAGLLAATVLSFWLWGRFMDRFGAPLTVVIVWGALAAIAATMSTVGGAPLFFALMALYGLANAGNRLAFYPMVMHFTDSADTMSGMGLHFSLWGVRWTLMPLAVIVMVDRQMLPMRYIFIIGAALMALGTVVMALVSRADRRASAQTQT